MNLKKGQQIIDFAKGELFMNDRDKRRPISAALRAVFDNNWFYVACIELWGVYVHLPLPQLPLYLYLPPLFLFCYAVFFAWELARGRRLDRARGDACVRPDPAAERGNAREEPVTRAVFPMMDLQ